ncbi:SIS domain-containing protein [Dermatophilaceae bacterium Soc4.6]
MPHFDDNLVDDEAAVARLDSRGTLRALAGAGAQVRHALALAEEAGIEQVAGGDRPRSVVVASLGGSAIVADVLELLAEPGSPVPVSVRRNVPLPGWVGSLDLVVAVSQSGRAPGPLALAAEAARRGASLLTVGAPDSPLSDVCARARGIHVPTPPGLTSSRTALWAMLTPVVLAAHRLGMLEARPAVLGAVADRLDEQAELFRPSSDTFVNPAKSLALELADGVPLVLGDGPLAGVAAARCASMLARTSRVPATYGELPDAASQVVACFDGPFSDAGVARSAGLGARGVGDIFADPFLDGPPTPRLRLLMLRDTPADAILQPGERSAVRRLADAVVRTASDAGVRVSQHDTAPGHPLERLAGHIALTDFAATYLALGLGADPGLSPHVADLRDLTRE